jgi:MbtH protein
MANPFEISDGSYYVLINAEGQYSIWPSFVEVPAGWTIFYGLETRQSCLDYINTHWNDMRPNSLIAATAAERERK